MNKKALKQLAKGKLVVYPTETAYGLGCDATNLLAVNKIFAIKRRPQHMPLSIIVADMDMAHEYAHFTQKALELAKLYWPGPLTLLLESKNEALAPGVHHTDNSITMRISSHKTATELVRAFGKPIVATSANASGLPTCYDIPSVHQQIDTDDIYIIDEGSLPPSPVSTIIDVRTGMSIIRQGTITIT